MQRTTSALGRYLESEGITVADFARRIGKSHGAVWRWAFTDRTPPLDIASLIQRGTGGDVPLEAWISHVPSVCQLARRDKSTKRGKTGRAVKESTGIGRRTRKGAA